MALLKTLDSYWFQALLWRNWLALLKEPRLVQVKLLQTMVRRGGGGGAYSVLPMHTDSFRGPIQRNRKNKTVGKDILI
jgi:hypothetical protein